MKLLLFDENILRENCGAIIELSEDSETGILTLF